MKDEPSPGKRRLLIMAVSILVLAFTVPAIAAALSERYTFEVPRERGDQRMEGVFNLALGNVRISEAPRRTLFRAEVELNDERLKPEMEVTRSDGTARVNLGFESDSRTGVSWRNFRNRSGNTWHLFFDRRTPLDLRFDLGLADADLDLTGLQVERLDIQAGMATARLAFDRPNGVVMSRLAIDAGAARFSGENLGNARFERMTFKGGAGSFILDFTGAPLPAGARADIDVGVSRLHVRLPEDRAVVLHASESWLTRVDIPVGYINRGNGVWHSEHVDRLEDAFHVHITAGVGRVTCETVARR